MSCIASCIVCGATALLHLALIIAVCHVYMSRTAPSLTLLFVSAVHSLANGVVLLDFTLGVCHVCYLPERIFSIQLDTIGVNYSVVCFIFRI